jgi:cyclopropane fatty-acyl-phospholipid synthase-like methyltransferase
MFLDWLELSAEKTLLDVACGSGGPALRMAASTGCSVVGIDLHEQAISTANLMASQRHLKERVEFRVVSAAEQLPFPDARFDAITCINAISHLPNRPLMIAECARLLKPGGRLLFHRSRYGDRAADKCGNRCTQFNRFFPVCAARLRRTHSCGVRFPVACVHGRHREHGRSCRETARGPRGKGAAVRQIEGEVTYEAQQNFLTMTACLAGEGRLSRFVYLSEKIS